MYIIFFFFTSSVFFYLSVFHKHLLKKKKTTKSENLIPRAVRAREIHYSPSNEEFRRNVTVFYMKI